MWASKVDGHTGGAGFDGRRGGRRVGLVREEKVQARASGRHREADRDVGQET